MDNLGKDDLLQTGAAEHLGGHTGVFLVQCLGWERPCKEQARGSEETAEETLRKEAFTPNPYCKSKMVAQEQKATAGHSLPVHPYHSFLHRLPASLPTGSPGNTYPSMYWGNRHQGQPSSKSLLQSLYRVPTQPLSCTESLHSLHPV